MKDHKRIRLAAGLMAALALAACGGRPQAPQPAAGGDAGPINRETAGFAYSKSSIWDIFGPNRTENTVQVNRYLWAAALDVLSFLPVESVDPFTGVIVTGYGRPPGGGRAYRATVHIKDPSLTARSLNLSLQTRAGPVSAAATRAVEDAILARARQLRVADANL